jgi:hypothetical protein
LVTGIDFFETGRCHHNLQVFSRKDTTLYRENIDAVHRMLTKGFDISKCGLLQPFVEI